MTTYVAAVCITDNGATPDGRAALDVLERLVHGYDRDGETPIYTTGNAVESVVLDVRANGEMEDILESADAALERLGYTLVGDWDIADIAAYAQVVRDQ